MIKIIHSADIQVKNREKSLYSATLSMLQSIENVLKETQADIFVMAGDLFEYATPNDSERRLIYNFISRIINIKTLKEIVLIPGNHDLEKEKKRINDLNHIESNALSIYNELIKNLDYEKSLKLVYSKKSQIIQSRVNPYIMYVIYSLEDNYNFDVNINETIKNNPHHHYIGIYHGMIREYAELDNIPLRKDVLNSLEDMNFFPENTLIMAGDIHKNLKFLDKSNGKIFIYPGSTMEHTHKEGSYFDINDKVKSIYAEDKVLKQYIIEDEKFNGVEFYKISDIKLPKTICYNTINFDFKIPYDIIKNNFESLQLSYGTVQTVIKVNSTNLFVTKERELQTILENISKEHKRVKIEFEYSKLVLTESFKENPIIKEIIEEKFSNEKTKEAFNNDDSILTSENIDNLLLSTEQLGKMFSSILTENLDALKNEIDNDLSIDEIKSEIQSLFLSELDQTNKSTSRYNIVFNRIKTNGFMGIGENDIDLNIPGIIRILGTNGIGKTTLYNMVRWFITGKVYDNMPDNQMMKNNLHVFHKKLFNKDEVIVEMEFDINNFSIVGKRIATRKWKNNITDIQKSKKEWHNFISNIERTFELKIYKNENGEKTFYKELIGEQAEKSLATWVGDTVKNILFLNQVKIESFLKTPSNILNDLILNFIGVDYLKKMEANLDILKTEYSLKKPARNKEDIKNSIIDSKIYQEEAGKAIGEFEDEIQKENVIHESLVKQLENINQSFINIGNIPELINNKKTLISTQENLINNFVEKQIKEKIPFTMIKPVLNQEIIDGLNKDISDIKNNINNLENTKIGLTEKNKSFSVDNGIDVLLEKILHAVDSAKTALVDDIKKLEEEKNKIFTDVRKYTDECLQEFVDKNNELSLFKTNKKNQIDTYQKIIDSNNSEIASGVCEKCGKPLSDNPEEHEKLKLELTEINTHTQKKIDICNDEIQDFDKKILLNYEEIQKLKSKLTQIDNKQIPNDLPNLIEDVKKIDLLIIEKSNFIEIKNNDKIKWQSLEKIQFGDYSIMEKFSEDTLTKLKITEKIDLHKKLFDDIKKVNESIEHRNQCLKASESRLNIELSKYTQQLSEYQSFFDENQYYNSEIDKHNNSIQEHNNKKIEYQKDLNRLTLELIELERKSPEFEKLSKEKTDTNNLISESKEKIDTFNSDKQKAEIAKVSWEKERQKFEKELTEYLDYVRKSLVWKVYSKLIKTNFKEIVFDYYRVFLNNTLNYLLQDVNFKLFWDNESELYMTDFKNGQISYQPVTFTSGMEICFLGLSLIYTIHLLNIKNSVSHLFIDEISGTLNDGKNLSYDADNYKELLVKILSKFKNKSIFIIDHNIDDLFETMTYEVVYNEFGSKYISK